MCEQAASEIHGSLGHLYGILGAGAPEALDCIHRQTECAPDFAVDFICGAVSELRYKAMNVDETEVVLFVTFIWAQHSSSLTAVQRKTLACIVEWLQPDLCHEPGWWFWDGEKAFCTPWTDISSHDGGNFAKSLCPTYKYPWDRF